MDQTYFRRVIAGTASFLTSAHMVFNKAIPNLGLVLFALSIGQMKQGRFQPFDCRYSSAVFPSALPIPSKCPTYLNVALKKFSISFSGGIIC